MARIISDKEITHTAIQSYLKHQLEDYSNYMANAPVFVTYYSKDHFESTSNSSLNSVANIFGADSPIKYNRIENTPLWSTSEISLTTDIGQFGQEADVQAEAIMIPGIINPIVDDIFTVFHDGADAFFRVNNVEYSSINGKRFCKFQFHLTTDIDLNDLGLQTNKEFSVIADGTAPEHFRVLSKSNAELMTDFILMINRFQDEYIKRFMKNRYDLPVIEWNDGFFYDYGMGYFIRDAKLFTRERGYRDEVFITPLELPRVYEEVMFNKTLYKFIQKRSVTLIHDYVFPSPIGSMNPESHVHLWRDPFYISWDYSEIDTINSKIPAFVNLKLYLDCTDNSIPQPCIEAKAVKEYLSNDTNDNIFDTLTEVQPSRGFQWFFYGPIIIYISKQIIEKLKKESIN